MKRQTVIYLLLCLVVFGSTVFGQRTKKPPSKPAKPPAAHKPVLPAEYEYRFYLDSKNKLSCSVVSLTSGKYLDPTHISRAMRAVFATGTDRMVAELFPLPKVLVEADPSLEMLDVLNVINELRVSENQEIELRLPDSMSLSVSQKPSKPRDAPVYPNPLILQVRIGDQKNLILNNEDAGVFPAFDKLTARLRSVFKERENTGVFRPGKNEIETTVRVVMPMTGYHQSDLILIARALRDAGSDSIVLDIDSYDEEPLERKELLEP